jgi:hypothetical protein
MSISARSPSMTSQEALIGFTLLTGPSVRERAIAAAKLHASVYTCSLLFLLRPLRRAQRRDLVASSFHVPFGAPTLGSCAAQIAGDGGRKGTRLVYFHRLWLSEANCQALVRFLVRGIDAPNNESGLLGRARKSETRRRSRWSDGKRRPVQGRPQGGVLLSRCLLRRLGRESAQQASWARVRDSRPAQPAALKKRFREGRGARTAGLKAPRGTQVGRQSSGVHQPSEDLKAQHEWDPAKSQPRDCGTA